MFSNFQRQVNAMKRRLNRYESDELVEHQRQEETLKKQQKMAEAIEQQNRTLQQASPVSCVHAK